MADSILHTPHQSGDPFDRELCRRPSPTSIHFTFQIRTAFLCASIRSRLIGNKQHGDLSFFRVYQVGHQRSLALNPPFISRPTNIPNLHISLLSARPFPPSLHTLSRKPRHSYQPDTNLARSCHLQPQLNMAYKEYATRRRAQATVLHLGCPEDAHGGRDQVATG